MAARSKILRGSPLGWCKPATLPQQTARILNESYNSSYLVCCRTIFTGREELDLGQGSKIMSAWMKRQLSDICANSSFISFIA